MRSLSCRFHAALLLAVVACSGACTDNTESTATVDLPIGWEDAEPVSELVQVECAEADFSSETATFEAASGSLAVNYTQAHFRCEQSVEGYFKQSDGAVDILVQPIDMDPTSVAGCDCAYGITFTVKPLTSGNVQATLYRRWDNWNDPNEPVEIASSAVTIP